MAEQAHASVLTHAAQHPPLHGMGTTLVMAHLLPLPKPRLLVLNVGDSRAYLVRAGTLTQLTRDHTLIEEYVRDGRLTPAQAARHPNRHVLTRAMGLAPHLESDLFVFDLLDGDLLLLCSDGLTKMLTDERILQDREASSAAIPSTCHPVHSFRQRSMRGESTTSRWWRAPLLRYPIRQISIDTNLRHQVASQNCRLVKSRGFRPHISLYLYALSAH
jgi:hypothetical protein